MNIARLFQNGGSQAVRLPSEFRFEGDLVYVRRDEATGDVILSKRLRRSWAEFVALRQELGAPEPDTPIDRDQPLQDRDPFSGWRE